jgi:putative ABC transport system substrate-binding protein
VKHLKFINILCLLKIALGLILIFLLEGVAIPAEKTTIGVVSGPLPRYKEAHKAFVSLLEKEGYAGKIEVLLQTPSGDPISKANAIKKLVALDVDMIVVYGATSASIAAKETNSIPIIFAHVYDPVGARLVGSMEGSGTNLTGVSSKVPFSTLIRTLKEISPVKSLGILYSAIDKDSLTQLDEIKKAKDSYGYRLVEYNIRKQEDIYGAMKETIGKVDCVYISSSTIVEPMIGSILPTAHNNKISTITQVSDLADKGVFLSIVPDSAEQGEIAARKVITILKGTKPLRIPIGMPTKVDFIINLKTAEAIGVKVPFDIMNKATSVIK